MIIISDFKKEIYDYFGYKEDWVKIPIDDRRKYFWTLNVKGVDENFGGSGWVRYAKIPMSAELLKEGGDYYQDTIYRQRFLKKWVYCGKEYTMICVDTHTDSNKFLAIYDNSKEQPEFKDSPGYQC